MWSGYDAFLSFFKEVVKLDLDYSKYEGWLYLARHSGFRYMHEEFCILCDRPEVMKVLPDGRPHCSDGPYARWRDGTELYALNGIRVPAKYVHAAKANTLSPADVMKEQDVDVRRELIRLLGIERMLGQLPHKVLDTQGNYELLSIDFPGLVQDARYLKMLNPSIGVWHLEGVTRECKTVQDAINWRAGSLVKDTDWKPSQLT